ncbi:MAG: hypothetical protein AB7N61_11345 [Acidimicrobiia bacterium]
MQSFVVRVWLPDRPGALGQVASRIGAVRGDVVGIDILERGAGRAIDELIVTLPDEGLVDLLVAEIMQVDGVAVEDVRTVSDPDRDHRLEALETAARLVEAESIDELLDALCADAVRDFDAEWAAVVRDGTAELLVEVGDAPSVPWLAAFLAGVKVAPFAVEAGPDDVVWAALGSTGIDVVLGRQGRPLRARERRQLQALARVAAARLTALGLHAHEA